MRLIELTAENFKRLRAVRLRPTEALTPIVGKNGAGKTSVLDAIAAALGGAAEAPELPIRVGAEAAQVLVDLGDLQVRRRWTAKGSTLEVATADGAKYPSPQAVLDRLVGELSFDPLGFSRLPPDDQARTLARVAGLDLGTFAGRRDDTFNARTGVNRDLKAARAQLAAAADPGPDVPDAEVSVAEVIAEVEQAQAVNREANRLVTEESRARRAAAEARKRVGQLELELQQATIAAGEADAALALAAKAAAAAPTVEVEPIRARAAEVEGLNRRVRAKRDRAQLAGKVAALEENAGRLTAALDAIDAERAAAVAAAKLPVPGLSIDDRGVLFNGIPFGDCSGAERLRVSVAIGLALNPKLKLMLIRDGSLLDADGMRLLAELAEAADAQVLVERVATGGEVGVLIEDGELVAAPKAEGAAA